MLVYCERLGKCDFMFCLLTDVRTCQWKPTVDWCAGMLFSNSSSWLLVCSL